MDQALNTSTTGSFHLFGALPINYSQHAGLLWAVESQILLFGVLHTNLKPLFLAKMLQLIHSSDSHWCHQIFILGICLLFPHWTTSLLLWTWWYRGGWEWIIDLVTSRGTRNRSSGHITWLLVLNHEAPWPVCWKQLIPRADRQMTTWIGNLRSW